MEVSNRMMRTKIVVADKEVIIFFDVSDQDNKVRKIFGDLGLVNMTEYKGNALLA
jgi:hypothetical protein